MPLKKLDQLQDWHRALLILPAIIVSNLCLLVCYTGAAFAARVHDLLELLIFFLPIPICLLYIGIFCQCRLELCIASSLALFLWLCFDLVILISFFVHFKTISSDQALFHGIILFGPALCAPCAYLGQRIRRKILTRSNNSQAVERQPTR
jgi:hypothetical protein